MSKKHAPAKDSRSASRQAKDSRAEATPLTPDHVGEAIGKVADEEQDVAPNLGGEEQMQDA